MWITKAVHILFCVWDITNIINMMTVRNFDMYEEFSILCVCSGVNRTPKWTNKLFN